MLWGEGAGGEPYGAAHSLGRLGDVALALGEIERAGRYYGEALTIAQARPQIGLQLDALIGQAALLARSGREEGAVELAALALHHPGCHVDTRRKAQSLLDRLADELSPDALTAAQKRGRNRDLAKTVEELLPL